MFKLKLLGRTHIPHNKNTAEMPPVKMPCPKEVLIPMVQHIGAPAVSVVKVGDEVKVMITEIDTENRKVALSIRAILEAEKKKADAEAYAAEKAERDAERAAEEERLAQERADMAPYIVGSI